MERKPPLICTFFPDESEVDLCPKGDLNSIQPACIDMHRIPQRVEDHFGIFSEPYLVVKRDPRDEPASLGLIHHPCPEAADVPSEFGQLCVVQPGGLDHAFLGGERVGLDLA